MKKTERDCIVKYKSGSYVVVLDHETREILELEKGDTVHIVITKV